MNTSTEPTTWRVGVTSSLLVSRVMKYITTKLSTMIPAKQMPIANCVPERCGAR
jgi:hypothetical protein